MKKYGGSKKTNTTHSGKNLAGHGGKKGAFKGKKVDTRK